MKSCLMHVRFSYVIEVVNISATVKFRKRSDGAHDRILPGWEMSMYDIIPEHCQENVERSSKIDTISRNVYVKEYR